MARRNKMQIKITLTFKPLATKDAVSKYTEEDFRTALCAQFQTGAEHSEIWVTLKDGQEIGFTAQKAE